MVVSVQKETFAARIARINKTTGGPAVLLCGVDGVPQQVKMARKAKRAVSITFKSVLGFPIAFLVGATAMLVGHVASYRYLDQAVNAADAIGLTTLVAADIAVATVIAMLLLMFTGYARKAYVMTAAMGFAAIITQEIELARAFPEIWAQIYSPHFIERSLQAGRMMLPEIATTYSLI